MNTLIDSHCHLDAPEFASDIEQVIDHAHAAGVTTMVTIGAGYGIESAKRAVQLSQKFASVFCTVGVHPGNIPCPYDFSELADLATNPKVVGIGETGLDYYRGESHEAEQKKVLQAQIDLALTVNKPLVIHCRAAASDAAQFGSGHVSRPAQEILAMLTASDAHRVGGVFHCFCETIEFAKMLSAIGFRISLPGIVTFKNATLIHDIARRVPLEQLLIETDAPFLAPVPFRGTRCEPAQVTQVAAAIARLRGLPVETVAAQSTANARMLFRLPPTT